MLCASIGAFVLLSATAALAAKPKGGNWTGTTSQQQTLTFVVSSRGLTVVNFEPKFTATCTRPGSPSMTSPPIDTDAGRSISVKHGLFHSTATNGKIHNGPTVLATASDQLHGKFSSRKAARGTYSVTFKFNNNAARYGLAGYTCKTGTVSWTATTA
jgi:hypothetical protein